VDNLVRGRWATERGHPGLDHIYGVIFGGCVQCCRKYMGIIELGYREKSVNCTSFGN